MAASTIIEGGDLMLFLSNTGTGGSSIACATNHTLSLSADTTDTSHKDISAKWSSAKVSRLSWSATTDNLFSTATNDNGEVFADLFNYYKAGTPFYAVFGPKSSTTTDVPTGGWTPASAGIYKGQVIITSLEVNAPNGDSATFSATFQGVGELTYTAPTSGGGSAG